MMIFSLFKFEEDPEGRPRELEIYRIQKKTILNCRLVYSQWKKVMDDVLKRLNLEYYTQLKCFVNRLLYGFPRIKFNNSRNNISIEDLLVPDFKSAESPLGIHIPTKSIRIGSFHDMNQSLTKYFVPFLNIGSHLSVLRLEHLTRLPAKILLEILQCAPNTKVLNLAVITLTFSVDDINSTLPPLPHLLHIRCTTIQLESVPEGFNVIEWILEPYKNQILTLATNSTEWLRPDPIIFPKLEMWVISFQTSPLPLQAASMCPCLERLVLRTWYNSGIRGPRWSNILDFVSQFSSTLISLSFDVSFYERIPVSSFTIGSIGDAFKNRKFLLLKTFRILYPDAEDEVLRIRYILTKFSNLKTIIFARFRYIYTPVIVPIAEIVKPFVESQQYWEICPCLEKIVVQHNVGCFSAKFIAWDRSSQRQV